MDAAAGLTSAAPQDADGFTDWLRPHWPAMYRLAVRACGGNDADDVLQEAVLRAWRYRSTFDPARGTPQAWLLRIVADRAAHRPFRNQGGPRPDLDRTVSGPATTSDTAADVDLDRAVQALPERQRLAVTLYYLLDLPVSAVAEVMGCASGTVRATLAAARGRLRQQLEGEQP
jgi:RNA polymerase sigma factor (sigma-70 family)